MRLRDGLKSEQLLRRSFAVVKVTAYSTLISELGNRIICGVCFTKSSVMDISHSVSRS
jgi:hypothetical protein